MKTGFDADKYLQEQSKYIRERVKNYDKLYLEFGGKLVGDKHAKRVLPGFDETRKLSCCIRSGTRRRLSFACMREISSATKFAAISALLTMWT